MGRESGTACITDTVVVTGPARMDIANLLAEAAEETFEGREDEFNSMPAVRTNTVTSDLGHSASHLRQAAEEVAIEDKKLTAEIFHENSKAIIHQKKESLNSSDFASNVNEDAEALLQTIDEENHNTYDDEADYEQENEEEVDIEDNRKKLGVKSEAKDESDEEAGEEHDNEEVVNPAANGQLIFACYRTDYDSVRSALKAGASISCRDQHGWTPLHWAASKGATDIADLLIEKREESNKKMKRFINAKDSITGWTPLHVRLFKAVLRHSNS